jgi:excisionase family DNA binding protein
MGGGKVMSSENPNDERLLTKGEVARLCRVDIRTVDRWLIAGKIGYHRTPSGRALFRKHDVLQVIPGGQRSSSTHRNS